jgi:hypothetical protein
VSGDVGSVLASQPSNVDLVRELLAKETETIEESTEHKIFRTGEHQSGKIAVFNKPLNTLDFLIRYSAWNHDIIAQEVAQLQVWRRVGGLHVQGLTNKMLFQYLLREYPALISDPEQTPKGREFWLTRMAEATALGYRVALVYSDTREVIWFDPSVGTFMGWTESHIPWATSPRGAASISMAEQHLISN